MSWVKLDDQFFVNRKAVAAGGDGRALFLAGLCYCAMQLNDGHLTRHDLPVIAAMAGVTSNIADTLVAVGLWIPTQIGWDVHGYLESNPSRQQVIAGRRAGVERQRRHRSRRDSPSSNGVSPSVPSPYPNTSSSSSSDLRANGSPVDDDEQILAAVPGEVWIAYAELMLAKQPPGSVAKPVPWKRRCRENANVEHGDTAARWWNDYQLTPRQLAEHLVDGRAPRNEYRRKAAT